MTEEVSKKLNGVIDSRRGEINRALAGDEQLRRDQQILHEHFLEQNREIREAHEKCFNKIEELKRFQGSTFDTFFNGSSHFAPRSLRNFAFAFAQ